MKDNRYLKNAFIALNIITTSGILVGGGIFLGKFIDTLTGHDAFYVVFFSIAGLIFAIWSMITSILKLTERR